MTEKNSESRREKDKTFEVLFRWKDKKKKDSELVGPVLVEAKTERVAIAKAAYKTLAKLAEADLLTLDVDVRVF